MEKRKIFVIILTLTLFLTAFVIAQKTTHTLALLETTDLHQYIMPYDYMSDKPSPEIGLSKVYTLIKEAREEYANTLLFDSGDFIQGSLVGDLEAEVEPLVDFHFQSIVRAYNVIGYDAVTVGNHEVTDYGLDFFERARKNANFPWLSANIRMVDNPKGFLTEPYAIIEREIDGIPIKIGVIGVTPPQISAWGRRFLEGVVFTQDMVTQAAKYIPFLEDQTDLVVMVAHTGISRAAGDESGYSENAANSLAALGGIDAMFLGHQHSHFPGDFADVEGIDNEKGLIHGVPSVLPGSWGSHLGVIELQLTYDWENGLWEVIDGKSELWPVTADTPSDPMIEGIVNERHEATLEYVRTPIGYTNTEITSYLSLVMDNPVTQLVNDAQIDWAKTEFEGSEYEWLPILSAAAPFIAGGRGGVNYYTHVLGDISIGSVTDIYIYPNTIYVTKLNGKQIIAWLEAAAANFNQIDPESTEPQDMLNVEFRSYNFDVIEGIEYVYDITKPLGHRVVEATFEGKPLTEQMEFLVVTNNYRGSGGGNFPHVADNIILETTVINREAIIKYIQAHDSIDPVPTFNWTIKPVETKGPLYFKSNPDAAGYIERADIEGITYKETNEEGWGIFEVDLEDLLKNK